MALDVGLGRQCQLLKEDLLRILAVEERPSTPAGSTSEAEKVWLDGDIDEILQAVHARQETLLRDANAANGSKSAAEVALDIWSHAISVQATQVRLSFLPGSLVRMSIPRAKHAALVSNNVDVQEQLAQEQQLQQDQRGGGERNEAAAVANPPPVSRGNGSSSGRPPRESDIAVGRDRSKAEAGAATTYRVGRLRAVIPVPTAAPAASQPGAAPTLKSLYYQYVAATVSQGSGVSGHGTVSDDAGRRPLSFDAWLSYATSPAGKDSNEQQHLVLRTLQQSLLSSWLVLVDFGECSDTLSARFVSSEPLTAAELNTFARCALRFTTCGTTNAVVAAGLTAAPSLLAASHPSASEVPRAVDNVVLGVERARHFAVAALDVSRLWSGRHCGEGPSGAGGEWQGSRVVQSRKRARGSDVGIMGLSDGDEDAGDGGSGAIRSTGSCNDAVTVSRADASVVLQRQLETQCAGLQRRLAEATFQLNNLRTLLEQKNGEIKQLLNTQRAKDVQNASELQEWQRKTEEQARFIGSRNEEIQRAKESQHELTEKTEKLVMQLKRLAEQTRKYKTVSDRVATVLHLPNASECKVKPEDVLQALEGRTCLE